ncbi:MULTISPECIES: hypothetical protein [unclassified Caballeronia]|uniref:hypothetical protein n=1 Tax=unclassified Caballeronia TaxID=2646786 RepID=UPI001F2181D7|nr:MULTISPECIES: hypothetical protein [unclassified Caballeronia]MCE4544142.1 hypothetical protein [Caballeronia sp. PC1]MCE4571293.1 hypothetical protein [Caballeronia sp. CLC5]
MMGIYRFPFWSGVEEVSELYRKAIVAAKWIDFIVGIGFSYRDDMSPTPRLPRTSGRHGGVRRGFNGSSIEFGKFDYAERSYGKAREAARAVRQSANFPDGLYHDEPGWRNSSAKVRRRGLAD